MLKRFIFFTLIQFTVFFVFTPTVQATQNQADIKSAKCWSSAQCKQQFDAIAKERGLTINYDPSRHFLLKDSGERPECPIGQGHCYAPPYSSSLSIPILRTAKVTGIGEYSIVLMNFLIVIAAILSVVTVSVAGLIYMTARGNASKVSEAKSLISKSIFSIFILLFSVTILQFVDPNLVRLNPLKIPMVKQIDFIPEGSSCEYILEQYKGKGVTLDKASGKCGDPVAKVTSLGTLEEGESMVTGLQIGSECRFTSCPDAPTAACVRDSVANQYKCLTCSQVLKGLQTTASAGLCAQFNKVMNQPSQPINKVECRYIAPGALGSLGELSEIYRSGYCAEVIFSQNNSSLNCEWLAAQNRDRTNNGKNCKAYNQLSLKDTGTWTNGSWGGLLIDAGADSPGIRNIFSDMCTNDICKWGLTDCSIIDEKSSTRVYTSIAAAGAAGTVTGGLGGTVFGGTIMGLYQAYRTGWTLEDTFTMCISQSALQSP
jgi:hypothetical protein